MTLFSAFLLSLSIIFNLVNLSNAPTYYYVNHSTGWQVHKAVENWEKSGTVRLIKVDSCVGITEPCTIISDVSMSKDETAAGLYNLSSFRISLNATMAPSLPKIARRMAACHEIGHFLGLHHSRHGCMRTYLVPNTKPYAGDWNRNRVVDWRTN